jgi:hypothetical protein
MSEDIATAVYSVVERLGGQSDILSIIGSWRDTLSEDEVLTNLTDWLRKPDMELDTDKAERVRAGIEVLAERALNAGHWTTRQGLKSVSEASSVMLLAYLADLHLAMEEADDA